MARPPQAAQNGPANLAPDGDEDDEIVSDPTGQSPDDPIEFAAGDDVARGNTERANAEPEPAALHAAEVPGKPDVARRRREVAKHHQQH